MLCLQTLLKQKTSLKELLGFKYYCISENVHDIDAMILVNDMVLSLDM